MQDFVGNRMYIHNGFYVENKIGNSFEGSFL